MKNPILIAITVISVIVGMAMAYKAGAGYDKGYIAGYADACNKHKASLDSLSAKYKKAIKDLEEAKYWCNKVEDLYTERLDSIENKPKPINKQSK